MQGRWAWIVLALVAFLVAGCSDGGDSVDAKSYTCADYKEKDDNQFNEVVKQVYDEANPSKGNFQDALQIANIVYSGVCVGQSHEKAGYVPYDQAVHAVRQGPVGIFGKGMFGN